MKREYLFIGGRFDGQRHKVDDSVERTYTRGATPRVSEYRTAEYEKLHIGEPSHKHSVFVPLGMQRHDVIELLISYYRYRG